MDLNGVLGLVGAGISLASLALSLYVLYKQRRDQGQAHFTAEWDGTSSLIYVNHGPGPARDVEAVLKSTQRDDREMSTPYIGASQVSTLQVSRSLGEDLGPLEISWRDNRRGVQTTTIYVTRLPQTIIGGSGSTRADSIEKTVRALAREEAKRYVDAAAKSAWRRRVR